MFCGSYLDDYWRVIKAARQNLSHKEENTLLVIECRKKLFQFECDVEDFREHKQGCKTTSELRSEMDNLRLLQWDLQQERRRKNGKRLNLVWSLQNPEVDEFFQIKKWEYRSGRKTFQEVEDELLAMFIHMLDETDPGGEQYLRSLLKECLGVNEPMKYGAQEWLLR